MLTPEQIAKLDTLTEELIKFLESEGSFKIEARSSIVESRMYIGATNDNRNECYIIQIDVM